GRHHDRLANRIVSRVFVDQAGVVRRDLLGKLAVGCERGALTRRQRENPFELLELFEAVSKLPPPIVPFAFRSCGKESPPKRRWAVTNDRQVIRVRAEYSTRSRFATF